MQLKRGAKSPRELTGGPLVSASINQDARAGKRRRRSTRGDCHAYFVPPFALCLRACGRPVADRPRFSRPTSRIRSTSIGRPTIRFPCCSRIKGWLEKEFEKDSIKIRWVQTLGSNKALEFLNAGSIDFGSTAGSAALVAKINGNPIKRSTSIRAPNGPHWSSPRTAPSPKSPISKASASP